MVSRAILYGWPLVPPCKPVSAPAFTVQPSIAGSFTSGSTLTAMPGAVAGFPNPTLTYRWFKNGNDTGVTASTYALAQSDVRATIDVAMTAANPFGSTTVYVSGAIVTAGGGLPPGVALAFVRNQSTTVRGQSPVTVRSA